MAPHAPSTHWGRFWGLCCLALVAGLAFGSSTARAAAEKTEFRGLYFPAGMIGTGTECPYTVNSLGMCVISAGESTPLADGRLQIRNLVLLELAVSWHADGTLEPRKTGYDVVVANASVDATFSGPVWGTWELHPDVGDVFTGTFVGAFENGVPAVRFVGRGTGIYEGQLMQGEIARAVETPPGAATWSDASSNRRRRTDPDTRPPVAWPSEAATRPAALRRAPATARPTCSSRPRRPCR